MSGGRLESTRFLRNRADALLGGLAGALAVDGPATIINSVFWDNYGRGAVRGSGTGAISVFNSTFVDNPGVQLSRAGGRFLMKHSVISGGRSDGKPYCRANSEVLSQGHNVFHGQCYDRIATDTDRVVASPPVDNVYNRWTEASVAEVDHGPLFTGPGFPLIDSPVIEGGDSNGCLDDTGSVISTDIMGLERSGPCDVGAFAAAPEHPRDVSLAALRLEWVELRSCEESPNRGLSRFIQESVAADYDRLPRDRNCDGLLDVPILLTLEEEYDDRSDRSFLRPTRCVATHVACEDPAFQAVSHGKVEFTVHTDEPCELVDGSAPVEPGEHGCLEGRIEDLEFDVGIRFQLVDAELVGSLGVMPGTLTGVLRGFLPYENAGSSQIPLSLSLELGSGGSLEGFLCPEELVERDGVQGYVVEFFVAFEAVTVYGRGLPPLRPFECE